MRNGLRKLLIILLVIAGLGLLFYPAIGNYWNQKRQESMTNTYVTAVEDLPEEDYQELWEAARAYNQAETPVWVPDAFSRAEAKEGEDDEYESLLNPAGDGVMGYLEIPKIQQKLLIYHGTGDEALEKGVGHLAGSSLPVGGENTHAVLAGHRGLPQAALLTDLNLLEEGDRFYLGILGETLAYEVDQILVTEPDETDSLKMVPGEDLVTLVTCTPYGVNTQRLLVRGHRVEYTEETYQEDQSQTSFSMATNYLLVACLGVAFVLLIWLLLRRRAWRKAEGHE